MPRALRRYTMFTIFVAPALLFFAVFTLLPMVGGAAYSFTNWNGLARTYSFIGFSNYTEAFRDHAFMQAILFTLKYVIIMVVIQNAIALGLALLIESRRRAKGAYRTVFFMPNLMSMIIGAFMWTFIFTKLLPELAEKVSLPFLDQAWTSDPKISFFSIVIVSLWQGAGYMMIIYVAALQGVPQDLKEAARIDGANGWQMFRSITLPMITQALTICIFLTLNAAFNTFDVVYGLTGGGPGRKTEVVAMHIFQEAFNYNYRFGFANAKAMILFLIVLIFTLIQVKVMKRREIEA
ncbi:carbohydrate ABC transporter permease [Cohnella sp. GCM10020058]|uniref:carbohydrate ABC transporter permease n=1 Tax=Cohnella sp. GCM10020058 TaxID=3317330 RepID=UPI00362FFDDF